MHIDEQTKTFGCAVLKASHMSKVLGCKMKVNLVLPPHEAGMKIPVLIYLAGLTCTPDNGLEKGHFVGAAAKRQIALIFPDTSPRELNIPGEEDDWDFGTGASFYLDAINGPWAGHYNMESYIVEELESVLASEYPVLDFNNVSIMGHSMGGHGALTLFLRHPGKYKSVSAFSPICHPSNCPWGVKAFNGYLGPDKAIWKEHDATELLKHYKGPTPKILIDIGLKDKFYKEGQLLPEDFASAIGQSSYAGNLELRKHDGYDHSYFFVSTFAEDHVSHHAKYLSN